MLRLPVPYASGQVVEFCRLYSAGVS